MPTEAYARSVVDKLMRGRVKPEIWQGKMSWYLYFLVTFLPLQILVSDLSLSKRIRTNGHPQNWIYFRMFKLGLLKDSRVR